MTPKVAAGRGNISAAKDYQGSGICRSLEKQATTPDSMNADAVVPAKLSAFSQWMAAAVDEVSAAA